MIEEMTEIMTVIEGIETETVIEGMTVIGIIETMIEIETEIEETEIVIEEMIAIETEDIVGIDLAPDLEEDVNEGKCVKLELLALVS